MDSENTKIAHIRNQIIPTFSKLNFVLTIVKDNMLWPNRLVTDERTQMDRRNFCRLRFAYCLQKTLTRGNSSEEDTAFRTNGT